MRSDFANDADLTHPWATRYRIPLLRSLHPTWPYEVALVVPETFYGAVWPDEREAEMIGQAIEFRMSYYREGWRAKMRARPLDADDTTNTIILLKNEQGWHYRRRTWESPLLWPVPDHPIRFDSLLPLLDEIWKDSPTWAAFRDEHIAPKAARQ